MSELEEPRRDSINVLSDCRALFELFDKDKNGSITVNEFAEATKALGLEMPEDEIDGIMKQLDSDRNGTIEFEEFCSVVMKKMSKKQNKWGEAIKQCHEVFDKNCTGYIGRTEFREVLYDLGEITNEQLIDEIFDEADVDGNGKIEFEEFVAFCKNYLKDDDIEENGQK